MSRRAWIYLISVMVVAVIGGGWTLVLPFSFEAHRSTFIVLLLLATFAQCFRADVPNHQSYYTTRAFQFAGVLLLPPFLVVLLVLIPHLVEWAKERLLGSEYLREWYVQPFNAAMHSSAALASHFWLHSLLISTNFSLQQSVSVIFAVLASALLYLLINHCMVGMALYLLRGVSFRESGVLAPEGLVTDLVLLLIGYILAIFWTIQPWLLLPALMPLLLVHRALSVPQLKRDVQKDSKTNLLNATYFQKRFQREFERVERVGRPLSMLMVDLDLLRNINNRYGHLAGDAVLAGIGEIIQKQTRSTAIAGRFGGEEFAIALPGVDSVEAKKVAEQLRLAVEQASFEVSTSPTPIKATMSIGVASFPQDASTIQELIHEADLAVYRAKLQGRNCVVLSAELPRSFSLQELENAAQLQQIAVARAGPPEADAATGQEVPTSPHGELQRAPAAVRLPLLVWAYVYGVSIVAFVVLVSALLQAPDVKLLPLLFFAFLTLLAEVWQISLYDDGGTLSVSTVFIFASAMVAGIPGVAAVSAVSALTSYARRRPPPYKTMFNWGTHLLAGLVPYVIIQLWGRELTVELLPWWLLPVTIAALGHFLLETGFVSLAISLTRGIGVKEIWQSNFQWLVGHWIVLGVLGLFLAALYLEHGIVGSVVLLIPVAMMRYAQKQYVDKTEASVRELKRLNQELNRANQEIMAASQSVNELNDELFLTLAKVIDARDPYVSNHAATVAKYAAAIAQELGISGKQLEEIRQAGFLHDIGKLGIPERILHKPTHLTPDEYEFVKTHARLGAEFLETSSGLRGLAPFVRHHHERWDGLGYPDGLAGEAIPLEARILALCDAVEAMASDRPYQPAKPLPEVIAEVKRSAGTHFDPALVEAFLRVVEREGEQLVVNSARELTEQRRERLLRPFDDRPLTLRWI